MRGATIGLFIAASMLLLTTTGVQAKAVETPFTACEKLTRDQPPEKSWVDEDGVMHIREWPYTSVIWGGLTGTNSGWTSINLDPATGYGDLDGVFTIVIEQGTFEGRYNGTITPTAVYGYWVGHSGDAHIKGTIVAPYAACYGDSFLEGVILSPQG